MRNCKPSCSHFKQNFPTHEAWLAYHREWRKNNRLSVARTNRKKYLKTSEECKKRRMEWVRNNRERARDYHRSYMREYRHTPIEKMKVKARNKLKYEVRVGRVQRGLCEVCQSDKVHAHHEDYTKPLEVRWLCPKHHGLMHRKYELSTAT